MNSVIDAVHKNNILINGVKYVDFDFATVKTIDDFFVIVESLWVQLEKIYSKKAVKKIANLFAFLEIEGQWESTLDRFHHEESMKKPVTVDGVEYEKIREFSLYYSGWECDSVGWLVDDNGVTKLVLSSHGSNYFGKISELEDFVNTYEKAIVATNEAIGLLKGV